MEHPDGSWMMDIEKEEEGPQYYTERGEEVEIMVSTFDEFLDDTLGEEWCYLFSPGWGWQCWKLGWGDTNTVEYDNSRGTHTHHGGSMNAVEAIDLWIEAMEIDPLQCGVHWRNVPVN